MAWFSALVRCDWDILVFWCMVAFSLLFLLVLLATVFFGEDQKSNQDDRDINILQQLLHRKLFPIEPSLGWQLTGVFNNLRVWKRHLFLQNNTSFTLHGCSAILSGEAEDIITTMQNVTKQQEWDVDIASITHSSPPKIIHDLDEDFPAFRDVIRITYSSHSKPVQSGVLRRVLSLCFMEMPLLTFMLNVLDKTTGRRDIIIQRIWKIERDGSCWMFSKNEELKGSKQTSWCYFLLRPVLDVSGKSVIHFITSLSQESTSTPKDIGKQLANRLASLRQYLEHAHLKLRPLTHTTLQHVGDLLPSLTEEEPVTLQDTVMAEQHPSPALHRKGNGGVEGPEPKDPRAGSSDKTKMKLAIKRNPLSTGNKWKKITPSRSRRNRMRVFAGGGGNGGGIVGVETDSSTSEDTGYSDWMSNKGSLERDGKAQAAVTSDPGVVTSMMDYMLCDEEPTSLKGNSGELHTLADQCIAELLSQSTKVAAIDVNSNVAQQQVQTGGWFFHSLAKDVVILQKSPVQRKYHCFLGKGLIRAPPEEVFKAVKNPRTRFIYDNMLKKMDIIKELDENVQIVHAVHEVPQLLRKESRDFCVLQASKIESSSHIVAFTSASVNECPPSEAVTRSHVLPSGWIIEPVGDSQGPYSMVTYIVQISIGGKGVPANFIQFLSKRVPLSVAYLRMFIETEHM